MTTLLQLGVYSHFLRKKTGNQQGTNREPTGNQPKRSENEVRGLKNQSQVITRRHSVQYIRGTKSEQ